MTDQTTTQPKTNHALLATELAKKLQMEPVSMGGKLTLYATDENGDIVSKIKTFEKGQSNWPLMVAYLEGRTDEKRGA